jgi:Domain of unknown function (DUF1338)
MRPESNSNLQKILIKLLGRQRAQEVSDVLAIDKDLDGEAGTKVSRAVVAQALNMLLFTDLIERVPAAQRYVSHCLAHNSTILLDHGAVRTIAMDGMGALPAGQTAITRILQPLGYSLKGVYPLERLKMTGHSYAQVEYPETIAQFFISELHPEKFTPEFQAALERVTSTSVDPLTHEARALLNELESSHSLSIDQAVALLPVLVSCFDRHHAEISLADYTLLLEKSTEAAWIATEGNVFNHVTDRVQDVDALSDEQKALGEPMKDTVEKSQSGRVRQTAFRAAQVARSFLTEDGGVVEKEVPGSFLEFITRLPLPDEVGGKPVLDLGFDSSNAQAIFKMTANTQL